LNSEVRASQDDVLEATLVGERGEASHLPVGDSRQLVTPVATVRLDDGPEEEVARLDVVVVEDGLPPQRGERFRRRRFRRRRFWRRRLADDGGDENLSYMKGQSTPHSCFGRIAFNLT